jgi:molecular chaperone GrpE
VVSFRKKKKEDRMKEKRAAGEAVNSSSTESSGAAAGNEFRVTDRRRIDIDVDYGGEEEQGSTENRAGAEASAAKPAYVEQLEERAQAAERKLVEVQARFEQLRAGLQRETDETRQRLNRAADERARNEKVEFIAALLPVADNLQRAIAAAEKGGSFDVLLEGVRGTANGFQAALVAAGVEPVTSVGAKFDPELHEAVDTIEVPAEQDGMVTAEYGRGYKVGDRMLRPARVQVGRSRGAAKAAE